MVIKPIVKSSSWTPLRMGLSARGRRKDLSAILVPLYFVFISSSNRNRFFGWFSPKPRAWNQSLNDEPWKELFQEFILVRNCIQIHFILIPYSIYNSHPEFISGSLNLAFARYVKGTASAPVILNDWRILYSPPPIKKRYFLGLLFIVYLKVFFNSLQLTINK